MVIQQLLGPTETPGFPGGEDDPSNRFVNGMDQGMSQGSYDDRIISCQELPGQCLGLRL